MTTKFLTYFLLLSAFGLYAQKKDTLRIDATNLSVNNLKYGKSTYLVYQKLAKDQPMQNLTLVNIDTFRENHQGAETLVVKQTWTADTIIHTAKTVFDARKMKTLQHTSWWKRKGYTERFDFAKPEISFEGPVKDETKSALTTSFNTALASDFLNWHSDLLLFPLLPFKENRVFKIHFYEPGFARPKDEVYEVIGSEKVNVFGVITDCWILNYKLENPAGYQRFWVSKQTHELLKEEDNFTRFYRYKLKVISED